MVAYPFADDRKQDRPCHSHHETLIRSIAMCWKVQLIFISKLLCLRSLAFVLTTYFFKLNLVFKKQYSSNTSWEKEWNPACRITYYTSSANKNKLSPMRSGLACVVVPVFWRLIIWSQPKNTVSACKNSKYTETMYIYPAKTSPQPQFFILILATCV